MLDAFREVWAVDFEFVATPGERPTPVCLVARELKSGRTIKVWRDQFGPFPLYSVGPDCLFVAYYASAELGCHLALGWPMPARILDLYAEFRCQTNGLPTVAGRGLLGALAAYGLDTIGAIEKEEMRNLIMRGGPWSDQERDAILDYCESDVDALARLVPAMLSKMDLPRALLRGRYMAAAARMEWAGVPIDVETLTSFRAHWTDIQVALVDRIDVDYGVFDGRTFKAAKFAGWLERTALAWPRLESGHLDLSDDAFREAARAHPEVAPLRELRSAMSELRLNDLTVGRDNRNRCILSAFQARTGPSVWLRGLIKPPPGQGVAYIDWSQQEFGIAAALSRDANLLAGYESGDPYLSFAKQAGGVPPDATKQSHSAQRDLLKACVLAVQYGMGPDALAARIAQPPVVARNLLRAHQETYRAFWRWSDEAVDHAMSNSSLHTVFGWTATERGIEVCGSSIVSEMYSFASGTIVSAGTSSPSIPGTQPVSLNISLASFRRAIHFGYCLAHGQTVRPPTEESSPWLAFRRAPRTFLAKANAVGSSIRKICAPRPISAEPTPHA
jgi:hypothetical protein